MCIICHENTTETPYNCVHQCHELCAETWIRNSKNYGCPMCKADYKRQVLVEASGIEKFNYIKTNKPPGTKRLVKAYLEHLVKVRQLETVIKTHKRAKSLKKLISTLEVNINSLKTELSYYQLVREFKYVSDGVCVEYDVTKKWQLCKVEIGNWFNYKTLIAYHKYIPDVNIRRKVKKLINQRKLLKGYRATIPAEYKALTNEMAKLVRKTIRLQSKIQMYPLVVLVPRS